MIDIIGKRNKTIVLRAGYYEGVVISLVCYTLYFYNHFREKNLSIILILQLFIPFLLVVWILFIVKHINDINNEKQAWIIEWKKIDDSSQDKKIDQWIRRKI